MNNDTKRLVLALFLMFGFLFVWTKYFVKPQPPVVQSNVSNAQTSIPSSSSVSNVPSQQLAPALKPAHTETFETTTKDLDFQFTNNGGAVSSVKLLHYFKEQKKDAEPVSVVPMSQETSSPLLWNLSFRTSESGEPTATVNDQNLLYQWGEKSPTQVSFSTMPSSQLKVQKFYRMTDDPYVIEHVLRIENHSQTPYFVDAKTSLFSTSNPQATKTGIMAAFQPRHPDIQAIAYAHEDDMHWKLADLGDKKTQISEPPISWSGFTSQYFLLTAIPTEASWNSLSSNFQNDVGVLTMGYPQRSLAPASNLEYVLKLYMGPKQMEILESVHPTLDRSIQLGSWIGGLARVIHKLLGWIYTFIPNYGWAIVILTILVRLAVFPLAQMQARSMKRMTLHKPAMDALKKKYANDREAHSRELMSYMRTNKINPASGCLPLLVQFPIFIALYRVLYNSIELRHAPFMFWIHDLSAHDPFFVLPVLVGITFFFQTKLNPTPMADPAQQTMMKIMPLMFSVFMIFLPSGLNLYIFVSTLWGIVQQYMVQKSLT